MSEYLKQKFEQKVSEPKAFSQVIVRLSVEFPENIDPEQILAITQFFDEQYLWPAADLEIMRHCKNRFGEYLTLAPPYDKDPALDIPSSYHMIYFVKPKTQRQSVQLSVFRKEHLKP